MSNYFRNLNETLLRHEKNGDFGTNVRLWIHGHWRLVGNLVMMFILACICLWGAYIASESNPHGSVIETVVPEIQKAGDMDSQVEKVIRSSQNP